MKSLLVVAGLAACSTPTFELTSTSYLYEVNMTDWVPALPRLRHPRAGHGVTSFRDWSQYPQEPDAFLVIGGQIGTEGQSAGVQPTLDIERCQIDEEACTIIGQLARAAERPQLAITTDGASVVVSDGHTLQLFTPSTGTTELLGFSAQQIVDTGNGVALLGISGATFQNAVLRQRTVTPIADPPPGISLEAAFATGYQGPVIVVSRAGTAMLAPGPGTWSTESALPSRRTPTTAIWCGKDFLAVVESDPTAYRFTYDHQWRVIAAPPITAPVRHAVPILGGNLLVSDAAEVVLFQALDDTWHAGPSAPPFAELAAVAPLYSGRVVWVGGADADFLSER